MSTGARIAVMLTYAILALAAAGRSVVQIGTKFADAPLPYALSGSSALLYALIAFALWRGHKRFVVFGAAVELIGVIAVGTLGFLDPALWPDETVWSGFGSGYGWVPLMLPIITLVWMRRERRAQAQR